MAPLLLLLPAALLFALLAAGCYPGECLLEPGALVPWSLRVRIARAISRPLCAVTVVASGGRLVAHARWGRGPPLL